MVLFGTLYGTTGKAEQIEFINLIGAIGYQRNHCLDFTSKTFHQQQFQQQVDGAMARDGITTRTVVGFTRHERGSPFIAIFFAGSI